jgi:hypothetical protein
MDTTNSFLGESSISTSQLDSDINQNSNEQLFFCRNIYKDYLDSAELNPLLDAFKLLNQTPEIDNRKKMQYRFFSSILHDIGYNVHLSELREFLDDYLNCIKAKLPSSQIIIHNIDEENNELFIHDRMTQSIAMNWKRADELYKKLMDQ